MTLALVIAAMAGYAFSHVEWRMRTPSYFFVLAWIAVPPIALLVPVYEEMNSFGLINTYWSVILLYTALNTPFNVYLMSSYLRGISGDFAEAARMDGANVHQIFGGIMMPLARPALATLAVFNFLFAWNEFIFALLLLQIGRREDGDRGRRGASGALHRELPRARRRTADHLPAGDRHLSLLPALSRARNRRRRDQVMSRSGGGRR